jgi:steroid delta-isomerase-like uncharacterized protein
MFRFVTFVSVLVLGVALNARSVSIAAQEASPVASPAAHSPLIVEWLAAFNAGDPDRLLALYTDDAVFEEVAIGLVARGPAQIRAHLERLFTAVPDIAYDVTSSVVSGDRVAIEWVVTGTYSADFPGLPPAADQSFSFRGASVFEMTGGKIRHYTEYWDAYGFLVQLGALPAPSAAPAGTTTP